MKWTHALLVGAGVAGVSLCRSLGMPHTRSVTSPRLRMPDNRTPILVELFTSEGCDSCPPADALLKQLENSQPVEGAFIIPLSEHVDYWDNARWRDRFSSRSFSMRQSGYAHAMHLPEVYTPQMIVDGKAEFLGSNGELATSAIAAATHDTKAQVHLSATRGSGDQVELEISATPLPKRAANETSEVFLAVTEGNLTNQVLGGENQGRRLTHTAVVRRMIKLGAISATSPYAAKTSLQLDSAWKKRDLSIVVFLQGHDSGHVYGSGLTPLEAN